jgi:hypothetical protein
VSVSPPPGASDAVNPAAALSSQTRGTEDEVLHDVCSRDIHGRACEPKEMILYSGGRHGLDECRDASNRDLLAWFAKVT